MTPNILIANTLTFAQVSMYGKILEFFIQGIQTRAHTHFTCPNQLIKALGKPFFFLLGNKILY